MEVPVRLQVESEIRDRIVEDLKKDTALWLAIRDLMDRERGIEFNISPSGLANCQIIDREQWKKLLMEVL